MNPRANLIFAWLWITLGFVTGALLGLKFDAEEWQGGYASYRRRLLRLGHISFFGLGILNALFSLTPMKPFHSVLAQIASGGFIVGGVTMPVCCFVAAYIPKLKPLFAIPVLSLILAGVLTFIGMAT